MGNSMTLRLNLKLHSWVALLGNKFLSNSDPLHSLQHRSVAKQGIQIRTRWSGGQSMAGWFSMGNQREHYTNPLFKGISIAMKSRCVSGL